MIKMLFYSFSLSHYVMKLFQLWSFLMKCEKQQCTIFKKKIYYIHLRAVHKWRWHIFPYLEIRKKLVPIVCGGDIIFSTLLCVIFLWGGEIVRNNSANMDLIRQAKGEPGQAPVHTRTLETNKLGLKESWEEGVNNPIPYLGDIHKRHRQWRGAKRSQFTNS